MNKNIESKLRQAIRNIIVETIKEAANVKVYLKQGEKPPKGAKVSQGSRGGKYYYTKGAGGENRGYPKKPKATVDKDKKQKSEKQPEQQSEKGNLEKHKEQFDKLDQHKKAEFLTKLYPKEPEIEDLVYTQGTFRMSDPPESYSEMREAKRMAKQYWKLLKKHPELKQLGFEEEDVFDPTEF